MKNITAEKLRETAEFLRSYSEGRGAESNHAYSPRSLTLQAEALERQ